MDESTIDRRLDLTGLACPEPVFRSRAELEEMTAGQVLEVLADDPLAELDFTLFCERAGHAVEFAWEGEVLIARIRKA